MPLLNRRHVLAIGAGGILGSLALRANAAEPGVSDTEILIGAFGPLTGPASWIGLGARDGMQLAFDEINANGGINGRKLRLQFEGAQTPAESISAVKKLVEQDQVFALLIGSGSTGAAAAADYLRETGVPAYNLVGATPQIREPFARNIFHGVFPHAGTIAANFAKEVVARNPAKVAVLVGTYELPQALWHGVEKILAENSVAVTTVQQFDLGARDFTAQLVGLVRTQPDQALFFGHFTEAALAIKQGGDLGVTGDRWMLDISAISSTVPQIAGAAAEGARSIWMLPHFLGAEGTPAEDFARKWEEKYGAPPQGRPNYIDMTAYGDSYILAVALQKTGEDLTRSSLIDVWDSEMTEVSPSTFGAFASDVVFPETFSPEDHDGNKNYAPLVIRDGRWQVDA